MLDFIFQRWGLNSFNNSISTQESPLNHIVKLMQWFCVFQQHAYHR